MSVINLLSPHVADLIAAGEVVERPASVIKELMENAFDAGAQSVIVEIRNGGASYIRVSDDGCGMAPEDAGIAFVRHATSKLHDERGLEAIGTMGFRGEALAAIASVSEVELYTRLQGEAEGTYLSLIAGDIQDMRQTGCAEGSSLTVKGLFFNTPARLKFLKSDKAEASACVQTALRCALGRPDVSVRFIKDGREEFFSPGDGRADSAVYTLLGRDLSRELLPCRSEDGAYRVHGFVSSPAAGRGSRAMQFFFCNSRYIRSGLMQAAVEQAYKNRLLSGRFPACVLYLDMSAANVDVNVHPSKTEVKFSEEKKLFDLIYNAVMSALEAESRTSGDVSSDAAPRMDSGRAETALINSKTAVAERKESALRAKGTARPDFYRSMSAEDYRRELIKPQGGASAAQKPADARPLKAEQSAYEAASAANMLSFSPKSLDTAAKIGQKATEHVEKPVQNVETQVQSGHKILGELFKTYILVEHEGKLLLIDKHAAHERLNFDRLKAQSAPPMPQTLLEGIVLRLDAQTAQVLNDSEELISQLGFEVEPYGDTSFIIRSVPMGIAPSEAASTLEELCDKLMSGKQVEPSEAKDELLHTIACKAAIKSGWDTERQELEALVAAVISGEIKYCPHGRPICVSITRQEIDRKFKR